MIHRQLHEVLLSSFHSGRAIVLLGPRQAGKTTLIKNLVTNEIKKTVWLNGDESDIRAAFANPTSSGLKQLAGDAEILVIDEAQRIADIGLCLKLLVDNYPEIQVVATGSSSFELANKINEPLTGRKWEYHLFPLSFEELAVHSGELEEKRVLFSRLQYGSYPAVVVSPGNREQILRELADNYLYKDILTWERIKKPDRLERLVQALAFQIGSEVSYHELGQAVGLDNETIEKYITLLEKAYIVFRLGAFSRNLRNELKKSRKIYFYDLGIRNAVINNFKTPALRSDIGGMWENYLLAERLKLLHYHGTFVNSYFWRTSAQQEIDYLEEKNGILHAFEFKWNPKKKVSFPKAFDAAYPQNTHTVVTPDNYAAFLTRADRFDFS